jgi:hypothetical protein
MTIFRKNFYSSAQQYDQIDIHSFDEGPLFTKKLKVINSSSISTKEIDAFRQGVEITQEKYAFGGAGAKIYAGTPGHIIRPNSYGVNNLDIISEKSYIEIDYFNPIDYLKAQEPGTTLAKVITFPIITDDCNQQENYILNGIIEPLTIRPVISFFSIEFPFESHAMRASFMGGNSDPRFFSGEQVLTVDYLDFTNENYYLDAFGNTSGEGGMPIQTIGYVSERYNHISPFDDNKIYLRTFGITVETHGEDMVKVFEIMTGSTGNYVPPNKKSSTSGFVYDNIGSIGTDSIAFGGLTY